MTGDQLKKGNELDHAINEAEYRIDHLNGCFKLIHNFRSAGDEVFGRVQIKHPKQEEELIEMDFEIEPIVSLLSKELAETEAKLKEFKKKFREL